jgi:ABC-type nitrate/sulfonate/bicarbonate transport system substrate-binding protein
MDRVFGSDTIEVIVFPGGFNWPIWVAQENGFFERNNVTVKITPTPNSEFQLTNLIDGKFDIAMTAIDNLIAYMEGQDEAPTTQTPDLVAVMGSDNGFLRLVSVPEVKTYADLKGKEVSVDARTTGYAFVLEKLIEKGGLNFNDVTYVKAGGVLQRLEALLAKKHAATMLISPFEVVAEARGFNRLANAVDVLGHYQGVVAGVRRQWAEENESQIVGFIRGFRAGLDWLYDPANKGEAIAILRKNLPNMAADLAYNSYGILMDPKDGFTRNASIDLEGVRTVLALRRQYGEPQKKLMDPMKYIDLSYYEKAKPAR